MANQQSRTQTRSAQTGPRQHDPLQPRQDHPPAVKASTNTQDQESALPLSVTRRGIDEPTWRTLCNSIFPGALGESILMAVDYCRARNLDVLKKPCHIVPMSVQQKVRTPDGNTETRRVWRDVILPGIYEYRITARRTGEYLGHSEPEFGPASDFHGLDIPEWCAMTVYRWSAVLKEKVPYPVRVYFSEVVATKDEKDNKGNVLSTQANARWTKAPRQMLLKCTEAAALREAFPDELGGEPTAEEMDGRTIEGEVERPRPRTKPATQAPRATKAPVRETTAASSATNGAPTATSEASGETTGNGAPPSDAPADEDGVALATDEQLAHIRRLLDQTGVTEGGVCEHFELEMLDDLVFDRVADVVAWINEVANG